MNTSLRLEKPVIFGDFDTPSQATLPFEKVIVPEKVFVIDSRQRDSKLYPSPSFYRVELGEVYKNVTSIELRGSIIPKSSYNVHSTNQYIDFSMGSAVSGFQIIDGGNGYTGNATVTIDPPYFSFGMQATATAIYSPTTGQIVSISLTFGGDGYSTSKPPNVYVSYPSPTNPNNAIVKAIVGTMYTAVLRPGQYVIGGNPQFTPSATGPTDLIAEVQDEMNYAVNGGSYVTGSTSGPFQVRLVSQYPTLDATSGTPQAANTNAAQFNRIQITNGTSATVPAHWELLWASGPNSHRNAINLLGFQWADLNTPTSTMIVEDNTMPTPNVLINAGTTYRASYDYDLNDDPKYILLSFWSGQEAFERLECDNSSINRRFATMVFDANYSNVLTDTEGAAFIDANTQAINLQGPVTKGPFYLPPGILKALRGYDFDQKRLDFATPIGKLSNLTIQFTKFGMKPGGAPEFYDFGGKNHTLIFSVRGSDFKSGQKY